MIPRPIPILRRAAPAAIAVPVALVLAASGGSAVAEPAATSIPHAGASASAELSASERTRVVRLAADLLRDAYVIPETGKRLESALHRKLRSGRWERITSPAAFAESLTAVMQLVSGDLHVRVIAGVEAPHGGPGDPPDSERARQSRASRQQNHGFERVERLAGNVGYMDLRAFMDPGEAGETAEAAMRFLAGTDALILDLRQNGGGRPDMVAVLATYFFEPGAHVHLNDIEFRLDGRTDQYWTLPHVPGPRYLDRDVFVLTSRETFSAAEEFAYDLQQLERATIVGEPTGGGAHPVTFRALGERFTIAVPFARSVNPVSRTNWQGVGVRPDVSAPAAQALRLAHVAALRRLATRAADDRERGELTEIADTIEAGRVPSVAPRRSM